MFIKGMKEGSIGTTLTWFVALFIILFLLLFFVLISGFLAGKLLVLDFIGIKKYDKESTPLISKDLEAQRKLFYIMKYPVFNGRVEIGELISEEGFTGDPYIKREIRRIIPTLFDKDECYFLLVGDFLVLSHGSIYSSGLAEMNILSKNQKKVNIFLRFKKC